MTRTTGGIQTITVNGTGNNAGETFTVELPAAGATADISGLAIDTDDISGVYVLGAAGTDTITGTNGADTIIGGAGSDAITGGAGVDVMTGGSGNDVYTIAAGLSTDTSATAVTDVITDFASGDTFVLGVAGSSTNYAESETSVDSLTALLTAANTALNGTVLYYFGVTGGNGYLITDDDTGAGANNIIQLTGVITFADNGAAIAS